MEYLFLVNPLIGGMLLGLSAIILLLFNGKIAGISGIVNGIFSIPLRQGHWRLLFIIGMLIGGIFGFKIGDIPSHFSETSMTSLALAGLLVGVGTRLGNGCTSGHGICGIGRFSLRSIVATSIFMLTAMAVVFIRLHIL